MNIYVHVYDEFIALLHCSDPFADFAVEIFPYLDKIYDVIRKHPLTRDNKELVADSDRQKIMNYNFYTLNQITYEKKNKLVLWLVDHNGKPIYFSSESPYEYFDYMENRQRIPNPMYIMIVPVFSVPNELKNSYTDCPLVPLHLTYGSLPLREQYEISNKATGQQLHTFLNTNSEYKQVMLENLSKLKPIQKWIETKLLTTVYSWPDLDFSFHRKLPSASANQDTEIKLDEKILTSEVNICTYLRTNPKIKFTGVTERWFDASKTNVNEVCLVYLGKIFDYYAFSNPSWFDVTTFMIDHHKDWEKNTISWSSVIIDINTAIVYYLIDTDQTNLLKEFPSTVIHSAIPMNSIISYPYTFPAATNIVRKSTASPRETVEEIAQLVLHGQSVFLKFSRLRISRYDNLLRDMNHKLMVNYITCDRNMVTNFLFHHLVTAATEMKKYSIQSKSYLKKLKKILKRKFNPEGRFAQTMSNALELAKQLPISVNHTQYRVGFFNKVVQKNIANILEAKLPSDVIKIVIDYLKQPYIDLVFSVPRALIKMEYESNDFNSEIVLKSCKQILKELSITNAYGIKLKLTDISDAHELSLKNELVEMHFPEDVNYIYFALPIKYWSSTNHFIAVIINQKAKDIYFFDSLSQENNINQTLRQFKPLVATNSLFENFEIKYPPVGYLKQQNDIISSGAFVVSNIIGYITQSIKNLPCQLSFEFNRMLKDAQDWRQPYGSNIEDWKYLIKLISLGTSQIEELFYEQMINNQNNLQPKLR